jgi:acyl-coenzyme A thioesterase PaaI-like protein
LPALGISLARETEMARRSRQNDGRSELSGCARDETAGFHPCHPACVACRAKRQGGLGLRFRPEPGGGLVAQFFCHPIYRSYPENVHGGHLALVLDAAMGHCLFQHEAIAVTGRLNVGFGEPVRIGRSAQVRVAITHRDGELYRVRGEIVQDGRVCVRAEGKFTTAGAPTDTDAGTC